MEEVKRVRKPTDVVKLVRKVARPISLKATFMASSFAFPARSSSKYFAKTCTTSLIPTTKMMVGSTINIKSISFPKSCIIPKIQTTLRRITVMGTHIPHHERKAIKRKSTMRTIESETNTMSSRCIMDT